MKKLFNIALISAALILMLTGCPNPFTPGEYDSLANRGLEINLGGLAQKTLLPNIPDADYFDSFEIQFHWNGEDEQERDNIILNDGSISTVVTGLADGQWLIIVTGKVGDDIVAQGSDTVTVESNSFQSVTIDLEILPYFGEDDGIFEYEVIFPFGKVVEGEMFITCLLTDETFNDHVYYDDERIGSIYLPAGFYIITIKLETLGKYFTKSTVAHIYSNMTTVGVFDFTDYQFPELTLESLARSIKKFFSHRTLEFEESGPYQFNLTYSGMTSFYLYELVNFLGNLGFEEFASDSWWWETFDHGFYIYAEISSGNLVIQISKIPAAVAQAAADINAFLKNRELEIEWQGCLRGLVDEDVGYEAGYKNAANSDFTALVAELESKGLNRDILESDRWRGYGNGLGILVNIDGNEITISIWLDDYEPEVLDPIIEAWVEDIIEFLTLEGANLKSTDSGSDWCGISFENLQQSMLNNFYAWLISEGFTVYPPGDGTWHGFGHGLRINTYVYHGGDVEINIWFGDPPDYEPDYDLEELMDAIKVFLNDKGATFNFEYLYSTGGCEIGYNGVSNEILELFTAWLVSIDFKKITGEGSWRGQGHGFEISIWVYGGGYIEIDIRPEDGGDMHELLSGAVEFVCGFFEGLGAEFDLIDNDYEWIEMKFTNVNISMVNNFIDMMGDSYFEELEPNQWRAIIEGIGIRLVLDGTVLYVDIWLDLDFDIDPELQEAVEMIIDFFETRDAVLEYFESYYDYIEMDFSDVDMAMVEEFINWLEGLGFTVDFDGVEDEWDGFNNGLGMRFWLSGDSYFGIDIWLD
ncbi:MAG: hypothetical protein FWD40_01545 [Treponema sp.]|nr:hypothetical protein [Treponema sp.]